MATTKNRPLTAPMLTVLVTIAHGYAHSTEQIYGTIAASARTEFYADSGSHNRLRGGTVNALVKRGLVESVDVRILGAYRYATLALTDAGWQALADAYGAEVRPYDDRPVEVLRARWETTVATLPCGDRDSRVGLAEWEADDRAAAEGHAVDFATWYRQALDCLQGLLDDRAFPVCECRRCERTRDTETPAAPPCNEVTGLPIVTTAEMLAMLPASSAPR